MTTRSDYEEAIDLLLLSARKWNSAIDESVPELSI